MSGETDQPEDKPAELTEEDITRLIESAVDKATDAVLDRIREEQGFTQAPPPELIEGMKEALREAITATGPNQSGSTELIVQGGKVVSSKPGGTIQPPSDDQLGAWFESRIAATPPDEYDEQTTKILNRIRFIQKAHVGYTARHLRHLVDDLRQMGMPDEGLLHILDPVMSLASQGLTTGIFASREMAKLLSLVAAHEGGEERGQVLTSLMVHNLERDFEFPLDGMTDEQRVLIFTMQAAWGSRAIRASISPDEFLKMIPPPDGGHLD